MVYIFMQIKYFSSLKEFTVLVFDARGVGLTGGDWELYNTEQWAQDFLDLLDYLNWTSNIHACGYSAGGCVLLKALLKDIGSFQSASLICTTAGSFYRPFTGAYTLLSNIFYEPKVQIARLIRINYTETWLKARPDDDIQFETNYDKVVAKIIERNQRSRSQKLGGMISQAIASLRHWVTNGELDQIRQSGLPITVITNTWDNFVHTGDSYHLRDKLQPKKFIVFENTGHVVPTARYNELNETLHSFWIENNHE
ncbi:Alpha/Beta hydrolase protein [Cunninghamella echinulata]|nr:Alpha/Beta hydrolase protein [Cunninghamella echinulata]